MYISNELGDDVLRYVEKFADETTTTKATEFSSMYNKVYKRPNINPMLRKRIF